MVLVHRSWPAMITVLLALLVCLVALADAYPPPPEPPGEDATPEEKSHYNAELRQYLHAITRQRFGKRDTREWKSGRILPSLPGRAFKLGSGGITMD
ncbi:peptide YY-like [Rhynchonycteris naso]